jgi:3-methylfumaryl-CoA hydratase
MWAGGSVQVRHPIRVGDAVRRRSAIVDVAVKKGRSGPLCLVTVEHQIETENAVAILDRQNVVYLAARSATTGPQVLVPAHTGAQTMKRSIRADAKTLFRAHLQRAPDPL